MGSGAMDYSTKILKIIYFLWCFGSLPDMDTTHMCVHAQFQFILVYFGYIFCLHIVMPFFSTVSCYPLQHHTFLL